MGLGTLPYPAPPNVPGGGNKGASGPGKGTTLGPQGPLPARPSPTNPWSDGNTYPSSTGFMPPGAGASNPILDQFNAIQQAQGNTLQQQYLNSLGMGELGYNNNMWYKTAQAGNDLARLDLQEGREIGLGRERNANDRGFAQRGFDIDSRGNALTRDMGYRANDSEAAARGSISSFGYGQNNRDILGQFGIAQDTTQLNLDKKMADLTLDDKALDSLGKEFGIRRDDVRNALKYGSTQLGLDWANTQAQLAQNLASGDQALQQQALNFMTQLMAMDVPAPSIGDVFPGGLPGMPSTTPSAKTPVPTTTPATYDTTGPYTLTPASTGYTNRR